MDTGYDTIRYDGGDVFFYVVRKVNYLNSTSTPCGSDDRDVYICSIDGDV